jgi:hypothetical protein
MTSKINKVHVAISRSKLSPPAGKSKSQEYTNLAKLDDGLHKSPTVMVVEKKMKKKQNSVNIGANILFLKSERLTVARNTTI